MHSLPPVPVELDEIRVSVKIKPNIEKHKKYKASINSKKESQECNPHISLTFVTCSVQLAHGLNVVRIACTGQQSE